MNFRKTTRSSNAISRNLCFHSWILLTSVGLTSYCGSSSNAEKPINQTQRSGNSIASVDAKYIDESPSISKDGTKILFRSGRDGGINRIYKSTWSGTAWSTPEKLSANSGLTSENNVKISPDGTRALVQGINESGEVLSICDVTAGTCSVISSTPWKDGQFAFSPDSTMFYYLKGNKSSGASLYVAMTTDGANGYLVGTADSWINAIWSADATSTYALVSAKKSSSAGKMTLTKRAFNTPASNAVNATESTLGADISLGSTIDPYSASTARLTVTVPIRETSEKIFTELGSYAGADKKSVLLTNEVHTWLINGTDEGTISARTGAKTMFAWISNDNTTIFTLNLIALRCVNDGDSTWGNAIAFINRADNAITWRHLKKPTDLSLAPAVTEDACDRTINGAATTMDMSISEMTVNRDATAATNTMVWSSGMTGDPEIFAAITAGGTTSVFNISQNRKP